MKIELGIILSLLVINSCAMGMDIVYPRSENITINSAKTFFIGNENPNKILTINGEKVDIHPSGGFKYPVNLEYGSNVFTINNGEDVKIYTIARPENKPTSAAQTTPITYDKSTVIKLTKDNVPLRSTPVDGGLNRLQHLQQDLKLEAMGEERGFYKVKLGRDDYAFISKDNAEKVDEDTVSPANLLSETSFINASYKKYEFTLDKPVPYITSETGSGLDVIIYDINQAPFGKYEKHIDGKIFGYTSKYDGNKLILTVKNPPKINPACPLSGLNITLDAGHGGSESGAIGCLGTKEKDVNLAIALNLKDKLQKAGANVFMTRVGDDYVSLNDRVKQTIDNNSDIFISIHNNSQPDGQADKVRSGTETYYFYPQSRKLALKLAEFISKDTGFNNGGARGQSFAVVRNTTCPAVLLEIGYMNNPDDNPKLIDKDFQNKITDGIMQGLESYLNEL